MSSPPRLLPALGLLLALSACAALLPGRPHALPADCRDCPEMIELPAGRFIMGTPASDDETWGLEREGPQHEVAIRRSFALGRFEVTRGQFARFVAETGDAVGGGCGDWNGSAWVGDAARDWRRPGFPQTDADPVVCVNWSDAQRYLRWLSARTGRHYRLPSEAEWEYAARAGTTTRRPWGDSAYDSCPYANLSGQAGWPTVPPKPPCADGFEYTAPVGSLAPNAWGLYDMLGNAWEWTADCWQEGYRGAPSDGSAWQGPPDCTRRVDRGAGWNSHPRNMRSSNRGNYDGLSRYNIVGFRAARD